MSVSGSVTPAGKRSAMRPCPLVASESVEAGPHGSPGSVIVPSGAVTAAAAPGAAFVVQKDTANVSFPRGAGWSAFSVPV